MKKRKILLQLLISYLLFTGCKLSTFNSNLKKVNDYALLSICIIEPFNSDSAIQNRAAVPSLPSQENLSYEIIAQKDEKIITKRITDNSENKISLEIDYGEWNLQVHGYLNYDNNLHEIFYGEKTVFVEESGYYNIQIPVYYIEESTGSVSLEIDVLDTLIEKMVLNGTGTKLDAEYLRNADGKIIIEAENIPSGTYNAVLNFYQSTLQNNLQNNLTQTNEIVDYIHLISLQEKINIRKNMKTDKWIKTGNTIYLENEQTSTDELSTSNYAQFILTTDKINQLINTSFYVASTDLLQRKLPSISSTANDNNSGTWISPFETLQAAINKIVAISKNIQKMSFSQIANQQELNDYTIYIDGPVNIENCTFPVLTEENQMYITIKPYYNSYGESSARIAGINQNEQKPTLQIFDNENIVFSDLILTNCDINVTANANFVLDGECQLTNGLIKLEEMAQINLRNITASTQNNSLIAKIKSLKPKENVPVIKSESSVIISEGVINRFRLQNPGFYLTYDELSHFGIIKTSYISINLPKLGQCDVILNVLTENEETVNYENGILVLPSSYFQENNSIIFSSQVLTPEKDDNDNNVYLSATQINMKLFMDSNTILIGEQSENTPDCTLTINKSNIFDGTYILVIYYEYEGIMYDSQLLIKVY